MNVRTRFAPSPTGYLHVGNIRTALYSWLLAKSKNGQFILRIEDTDTERSNTHYSDDIINTMNWLNISWDEGPFYQTKRLDRYLSIIDNMLKSGTAYKCYCSKERLAQIRKNQILSGEKPHYDGYCRNRHYSNIRKSYVVRFCNPKNGIVSFHDQVYGLIKVNNQELDDLVIKRSNGLPTYNLCVVVDDHDMKITHIVRGKDHITNTFRQINIINALKIKQPIYVHIPMILDINGKKLSKRDEISNVIYYRNSGYLPEALLNYLLLLGWSYGNREIFSVKEMKKKFKINDINKSSGIFDIKKFNYINGIYIRNLSAEYITSVFRKYLHLNNINFNNGPELIDVVRLFSNRCRTLKDMANLCKYLYQDLIDIKHEVFKKYLNEEFYIVLKSIFEKIKLIDYWSLDSINNAIRSLSINLKIDINKIRMLLRVIITGTDCSPDIYKIIYFTGYYRTLRRIKHILQSFSLWGYNSSW